MGWSSGWDVGWWSVNAEKGRAAVVVFDVLWARSIVIRDLWSGLVWSHMIWRQKNLDIAVGDRAAGSAMRKRRYESTH